MGSGTQYSSQNVLSIFWVRTECNHSYLHIIHLSKETVWRYADHTEHGKKFCKHLPPIPEERVKFLAFKKLEASLFSENQVKKLGQYRFDPSVCNASNGPESTESFELLPN